MAYPVETRQFATSMWETQKTMGESIVICVIRCWCVLPTHRHVGSTASAASLSLGVNEASADPEIAEFDLTFSVQEDV